MQLHRYLFAPILLAVAVWMGPGHQEHPPRPTEAAPAVAPQVKPAVERAVPARPGQPAVPASAKLPVEDAR